MTSTGSALRLRTADLTAPLQSVGALEAIRLGEPQRDRARHRRLTRLDHADRRLADTGFPAHLRLAEPLHNPSADQEPLTLRERRHGPLTPAQLLAQLELIDRPRHI